MINIRPAGPEDKEKINDLFREMLLSVYSEPDAKGYEEGALDRFFTGGGDRVYVAEEGEVVAFLSVEVHREERDYLYLDDFSVTKAYRGKGIGSRLLAEAEAYAKELGIPAMVLHVEKSNEGALRLYRRQGFSVFRDDGERLLMVREGL